jgi:leucyl-tRNA synthetase
VVRLAPDAGSDAMQQAALAEPKVQAAIAGKHVVKVIVVPGKLINIVVK